MTRPNNAAIPLASLDLLVSIVNSEYADPELLVGLLAKLSRKFAEPHVFTQLKALHALLSVAFKAEDKPRLAWSRAICSMQGELDSKVDRPFFSLESLAASKAATAQELAGTELARLFADHAFLALQLLSDRTLSPRLASGTTPLSARTIKSLVALHSQGCNVSQLAAQIDTPLSRQIIELVDMANGWAAQRLLSVYENGQVADPMCEEVETILRSRGIPFAARSCNASEGLPPKTTRSPTPSSPLPTAIPSSLRQSVTRSVDKLAAQRMGEDTEEKSSPVSPSSPPTSPLGKERGDPNAAQTQRRSPPKPKSKPIPPPVPRSVSKPRRSPTMEAEATQKKGKSRPSSRKEKRSKQP